MQKLTNKLDGILASLELQAIEDIEAFTGRQSFRVDWIDEGIWIDVEFSWWVEYSPEGYYNPEDYDLKNRSFHLYDAIMTTDFDEFDISDIVNRMLPGSRF